MSPRPVDWTPLAEGDPIGGDPGEIVAEASHYRSMADEIAAQVTRLRRIGAGGELVGQSADQLRATATQMADRLDRTGGAYRAVAGALTDWVPQLETAHRDSLQALAEAQDAQRRLDRLDVPVAQPAGPRTPERQAAEAAAERAHQAELDAAQDALAAARAHLHRVIQRRDEEASRIARAIRGALDESLKDSWWDEVKEWTHDHAATLKALTDALSWIATALAVVAIFIPGVNVLLLLALTGVVLLGHGLLAASGEGSWTDVAMDVFALATFGTGRILTSTARLARATAVARTSAVQAQELSVALKQSRGPARQALKVAAAQPTRAGRQARIALRAYDRESVRLLEELRLSVLKATAFRPAPAFPLTAGEKVAAGGDESVAALARELRLVRAEFGGDPAFDALAASWAVSTEGARAAFASGAAVDLVDKMLAQSDVMPAKPHLSRYDEVKGGLRYEVGSTW